MSRSRKHTPIVPMTGAGSEKKDKQEYNRRLRHRNRQLLHQGEEDLFLEVRDVSDPWTMAKDGSTYLDPGTCRNWQYWEEMYEDAMRK